MINFSTQKPIQIIIDDHYEWDGRLELNCLYTPEVTPIIENTGLPLDPGTPSRMEVDGVRLFPWYVAPAPRHRLPSFTAIFQMIVSSGQRAELEQDLLEDYQNG